MSIYCNVCTDRLPRKSQGDERVCTRCKNSAYIAFYKVSKRNYRVRITIPGRKQILELSYNQWKYLNKAIKEHIGWD